MKKLLLFSSILAFSIFTNCKKKHDDPTPTTSATTSGSVTVSGGSTTILTVEAITGREIYALEGHTSSGYSLIARFFLSKPTVSSTRDLANDKDFLLVYGDSSKMYIASSGTANVTVNGTAIAVSFTNITFTDQNTSTSIIASGTLYTSSWQ